MSTSSTRKRLTQAALDLFTAQGVSGTTTRQIAEAAQVNEVTLFRHFGNKQGLLLAVLEESSAIQALGESLVQTLDLGPLASVDQALKQYARQYLDALERVPELVRSLVGEADQYPIANRQALGRGLTQTNRYVACYLEQAMQTGQLEPVLPAEKLAGLLNSMLLGYAVIEFTSESHQLWDDREDFLKSLVHLVLKETVVPATPAREATPDIADLPGPLVHQILQRAKKVSLKDYALAYILFAAGLGPADIEGLERGHQISNTDQHILQVKTPTGVRQVPVNQWILGKRYGSYTANPLSKWLKSRQDKQPHLFLNDRDQPISQDDIQSYWQRWTEGLLTPKGTPPAIAQTQQTWCIDMLSRGMSLANLSLLTGMDLVQLQAYARRAKEKAALDQATRLDQKPNQRT